VSDYVEALRAMESKIRKAAALELELIERAMLLRARKERLMQRKQEIEERIVPQKDETGSNSRT